MGAHSEKAGAGHPGWALTGASAGTFTGNPSVGSGPKRPLHVALVHDHPASFAWIEPAFRAAGVVLSSHSYQTPDAAVEHLQLMPPGAALLDLPGSGAAGEDLIRILKMNMPTLPVVVLSESPDKQALLASLNAGANGHLIKPVDRGELLMVVRSAAEGTDTVCAKAHRLLPTSISTRPAGPTRAALSKAPIPYGLTPRELQILFLRFKGRRYKEISVLLNLSERTLNAHIDNSYRKLDVHNRAEAKAKCLAMGLIKEPPPAGVNT
jgi:DNA-binding NarL/FixJ family response regulator